MLLSVEYRHVMRKLTLKKAAVPSQNLPVASYSRRKNTAQNENRAQRLLNRNANQTKDSTKVNGVIAGKTNDSNQQLNDDRKIAKSSFVNRQRTKSDKTSVKVSTVVSALPCVNVMDLLQTRNQLNAWTGIPTFFLLRKIEERVSLINPKAMEGIDLSLLECIVLCFIRLKTKLPFICLTSLFHISTSSVSKIFYAMLPIVKKALDDVDHFSSTIESNDNQLIALRMYGYNEVRAIVDCVDGDGQSAPCK